MSRPFLHQSEWCNGEGSAAVHLPWQEVIATRHTTPGDERPCEQFIWMSSGSVLQAQRTASGSHSTSCQLLVGSIHWCIHPLMQELQAMQHRLTNLFDGHEDTQRLHAVHPSQQPPKLGYLRAEALCQGAWAAGKTARWIQQGLARDGGGRKRWATSGGRLLEGGDTQRGRTSQ